VTDTTVETQGAFMAAAAAAVLLVSVAREHRDASGVALALGIAAFAAFALGYGIGMTPAGVVLVTVGLTCTGSLAPAAAARFTDLAAAHPALRAALVGVPLGIAALWIATPHLREGLLAAAGGWALIGTAISAHQVARRALQASRAPDGGPDQARLRYVAIAHAAVPIAAVVDLCAWHFGRPRVATLVAGLFCFYLDYLHLARIRIKDLRQLMGNAVGLTFTAAALTGAFALLWLWGRARFDVFVFNAFLASFLLLLFLQPLRARIQGALDRRFVASKLALERAFRPLHDRLAQVLTLDEFLAEVFETCEATGRLRASAVFLREGGGSDFAQVGGFGVAPRSRWSPIGTPPFLQVLDTGRALQREELERAVAAPAPGQDPAPAANLLHILTELDAQVVLPLRTESQLVGFWTLRDHSEREAFSSRELEFLSGVARDMARTVENSKTFARLRARDRLAMVGEMSAGLAHEIRNPLATIRGAVALLETAELEEAGEIRRLIEEEVSRLDRVVDTFLNYANPPQQPVPLLDLAEFVRSRVAGAQLGRGPAVEVALAIEPDLPCVPANPDHLERVLDNLLANAYDALAGQARARIDVSLRRAAGGERGGDAVELAIEDNGPGMDAATLERAFIPFFTTKTTGTGLGLPLCERLVRAQGGEIRLHSVPGERTQVRVRLPVDRVAAAEAP
jgi:two-component system, NtrC family, sensor histidine kinase HydH